MPWTTGQQAAKPCSRSLGCTPSTRPTSPKGTALGCRTRPRALPATTAKLPTLFINCTKNGQVFLGFTVGSTAAASMVMGSPHCSARILLMVVAVNYGVALSLKIRPPELSIHSLADLTTAAPYCPSTMQPVHLRHDENWKNSEHLQLLS
jgi:hypothetical protein